MNLYVATLFRADKVCRRMFWVLHFFICSFWVWVNWSMLRLPYTPFQYYGHCYLSFPSSSSTFRACSMCSRIIWRVWSSKRFLPIVVLALVFNITNAIGFTYAYASSVYVFICLWTSFESDRDAKERWASSVTSGAWNVGFGGFGGQIIGGVVKNSVGRVFGWGRTPPESQSPGACSQFICRILNTGCCAIAWCSCSCPKCCERDTRSLPWLISIAHASYPPRFLIVP